MDMMDIFVLHLINLFKSALSLCELNNIAQRTNFAAALIGIPKFSFYTTILCVRSEIANFNISDCYKYPGSTEEYWGRQDAAQAIALVSSLPSSAWAD
jgi:hypothetical protein